MTPAARRLIFGVAVFLVAGTIVGYLYDAPLAGLAVAALLALLWQLRQLLAFERALRTGDFDDFRSGEGIWEQIVSRFRFERERASRRKSNHRALLREIQKSTNAMPDGAVILDVDNEIVNCNRAAKALAGLKRRKDRGQRIDNILRDPLVIELLQSGDPKRTVEIQSPKINGNWLSCRVVPYGAEQKLFLIRDITESRRLSKMRRDFVANASHELRSPLTVITGYLDALAEDDTLQSSWARPLAQMRAQAARMNRILADLLELSRLESAGSAEFEEIDMVRLLERLKNEHETQGNSVPVVLNLESTAHFRGVETEIESVVMNLLSNAVRHSPAESQVIVTWRSSPDGADLLVSDSGEGIEPDLIPRLTERFFRIDRGRSRDDGGVGLGLAIVKHIVLRHDGDLNITSEPGTGSEFRCSFPPKRVAVSPPVAL